MDPITGAALISGGASLLGGLFANNSAKKAAQAQMDFQQQMANTAHQRQVADLKAAGLNPMLSVMGGHGSPSPVGATYQPTDVATPAVNSAKAAMEMRNLKMQNLVMETQGVLNDSQAAQAMSSAALNTAQAEKTRAETHGTEFKNRGFDVLNHFLEPAAQLIKGNTSSYQLKREDDSRDYRGLLPPPVFSGTSASGRAQPKSNQ